MALAQALENIYQSLRDDNHDIDTHIAALKKIMTQEKMASVEIDTAKLVMPNRQGKKMLQSYFKQRGVAVTFQDK